MTINFCPFMGSLTEDDMRKCDEVKCEWWDADESCCCIRVAVRALEDLCDFAGRIETITEDRGEHP